MGAAVTSLVGRRRIVAGLVAVAMVAIACRADDPADQPADRVTPPRTADAREAAVAVRATACRPVTGRGAGLMVAPGRVLTAAHVVAGATSIGVVRGGLEVEAEVVAFDPVNDLAVLDVPPGFAPYLPLAVAPPDGSFDAEVVLFRDERAVVAPVRVLRRVTINTEDIYRGGTVARPGYELRVDIARGDSGAVLTVGGEAIAVVWSRSRDTEGRAWAVDAIRGGGVIDEQLASGSVPDDVDLGRCA